LIVVVLLLFAIFDADKTRKRLLKIHHAFDCLQLISEKFQAFVVHIKQLKLRFWLIVGYQQQLISTHLPGIIDAVVVETAPR
jgi:hypothetical protein